MNQQSAKNEPLRLIIRHHFVIIISAPFFLAACGRNHNHEHSEIKWLRISNYLITETKESSMNAEVAWSSLRDQIATFVPECNDGVTHKPSHGE